MLKKNNLNIWILQDGEQLPLDPGAKPMRSWRLGEELSKRGHCVTWWSSNFNHMKKKRVSTGDNLYTINENFTLKLLDCGTYSKNMSLSRILHHKKLGIRFCEESEKMEKPDIIVACHPIIEFSYEAVKYGKKNNIPVIVDVRDTWPDSFKDYFPGFLSPIINLLTYKMRKKAKFAFSNATSVVSMCQDTLEWALENSDLSNFNESKVFFLSCEKNRISEKIPNKFQTLKDNIQDKIIISFIGTFGNTYDLETICRAAKIMKTSQKDLFFILAGSGEKFKSIKAITQDEENIILTGWVDKEEASYLVSISHIGLVPIKNVTIPNKFVEIISNYRPVLSSGRGQIADIIEKNNVGRSYKSGDVGSFIENLNFVVSNNKYVEMKDNCKKLFHQFFDAEIVYKAYADYVEDISKKYNL